MIVILSLLIGNLFKYHFFTVDRIIKQKEFISVTKDVITLLTIVLGAIFSYYRFFNGRTFSAKAEIEIEVTLIAKPGDKIMHALTVSIINIGTLSIWNPIAKVAVRDFNNNDEKYKEAVVEGFDKVNYHNEVGDRNFIINPGEKAHFMYWKEFDLATWAVTYVAEIKCANNRIWQKTITVANKIED
ncbi:hypothetical protein MuYL_2793 [Mucilaginibacter xinganensis]|uniref:Uncharacterized protein n=2 Tax=Mucilaginibacter xinganensis TaxID=1234841 RepID=A0A223NY06_9SPHI|nr:hypothetical protein MuYL_2793 [Mucilaginibacter xinganensis]